MDARPYLIGLIGFSAIVSSTCASYFVKQTSVDKLNPVYFEAESVYLYRPTHGTNDDDWSGMEQKLLSFKSSIKAIENKSKIEGDWGKLHLRLDPKEYYKKTNLNYLLNF